MREFTIDARDQEHWEQILRAIGSTRGAKVLSYTDRTFEMHQGGKIEIHNKYPLKTRDDLSMAYTPGVARVCTAIAEDRSPRLRADDQAQHGRRGHRRQRRARARRHRPRGGDAGDGGQGDAVQGVRRRRRLPDLPRHPRPRGDHPDREADRADLRRHQPRGHLGAALLRDRGPAQGGARHPRLPRRPARHRGRRDGGALQRAEDRRQADRGPAGAVPRPRRRRHGLHEDDAGGGRHRDHRLRPQGRRLDRPRGLPVGRDDRDQALVRREHQRRQGLRRAQRRDRGLRPVRRALRPRADRGEVAGEDERRRDRLRDGQPDPRGDARGRRALRADHGHRPLRLPEPDQQRALLPRRLPRRPRRRRPADHRGDEDGGGARHRRGRRRRGPGRGLHHPQRLRPRRRPRGRQGRRRGGQGRRHRPLLRGDRDLLRSSTATGPGEAPTPGFPACES